MLVFPHRQVAAARSRLAAVRACPVERSWCTPPPRNIFAGVEVSPTDKGDAAAAASVLVQVPQLILSVPHACSAAATTAAAAASDDTHCDVDSDLFGAQVYRETCNLLSLYLGYVAEDYGFEYTADVPFARPADEASASPAHETDADTGQSLHATLDGERQLAAAAATSDVEWHQYLTRVATFAEAQHGVHGGAAREMPVVIVLSTNRRSACDNNREACRAVTPMRRLLHLLMTRSRRRGFTLLDVHTFHPYACMFGVVDTVPDAADVQACVLDERHSPHGRALLGALRRAGVAAANIGGSPISDITHEAAALGGAATLLELRRGLSARTVLDVARTVALWYIDATLAPFLADTLAHLLDVDAAVGGDAVCWARAARGDAPRLHGVDASAFSFGTVYSGELATALPPADPKDATTPPARGCALQAVTSGGGGGAVAASDGTIALVYAPPPMATTLS